MKLVYTGPSHAVEIVGGGLAVNGEPFDVPDELGRSLLEQESFSLAEKKAKDA